MTQKFAAWLYRPDGYIRQIHAAPGHVLPVLRTIADTEQYRDNEIIRRYEPEIELMSSAAVAGHNLGWETPEHRANVRAGAIINSGILAEMVQRVVLNDEKPRAVLGKTAIKIEAIMQS